VIKRRAVTAVLLALGGLLIVGGIVVEVSRQSTHPLRLAVSVLAAAGVWVLISRTDVGLLLRALDTLRAALPVMAYLVASVFIGSSHGTTAFDEIGAQVIVVLLLALALEARFFRLHRVREPLELGATLFTMLVLGAGEFYALQGVATGDAQHADVIGGAVATGFVAVAVAALAGPSGNSPGDGT
jgi:hypothetical protein